MRVDRRLATALRELGVDTVFGLMGDGNMGHLIGFAEAGGTVVDPVTEGAAVSMADGYARVGRRVGVASVTHGPGATNTLTALTEAVRARTPLVVLTGDTPPRADHLQRFDLAGLAALAGADYHRVDNAAEVAADLESVFRRALTTCRPVLFDLPVPLQRLDVAEGPALRPVRPQTPGDPDEDALDRALGVLASARRPVILAGRGAADAPDAILALGRCLGAPVGTTLLAKGMFAGEPLDLGIVGTLGSGTAIDTVQAADCLLVLGAGLNRYTTVDGSLLDTAVVQVERDPGRIAEGVSVPVVGDVGDVVRIMLERLGEIGHSPAPGHRTDLAELLTTERDRPEPSGAGEGFVDPRTMMRWLDQSAPRDRVVVTDTGRFAYAPWRLLGAFGPGGFVHTCNFASIGLGLGTAIGAAVASGRPTILVAGDGGGMMNLLELATAVRLRLPLLVVICNDGAYGMEYTHLVRDGEDPAPALHAWPDFAEVAIALGARAVTVGSADDLDRLMPVVAGLSTATGPVLVDVRCDPSLDVSEPSPSRDDQSRRASRAQPLRTA